jgi:hypothetical protein
MGPRPKSILVLTPSLRLADAEPDTTPPAARRHIARENHAAALAADDARWLFAQHVKDSVEGGRAALVRPQIRRNLVTRAEQMGLRPFDANLVIAIVQDAARRGEHLDQSADRLAFIPAKRRDPIGPLMILGAAIGLAAGLVSLLIGWLS